MFYQPQEPKLIDSYRVSDIIYHEDTRIVEVIIASISTTKLYRIANKSSTSSGCTRLREFLTLFIKEGSSLPPRIEWSNKSSINRLRHSSVWKNTPTELEYYIKVDSRRIEHRKFRRPCATTRTLLNNPVEQVKIDITSEEIILCVMECRGQDTLYFHAYNTNLGSSIYYSDLGQIKQFVASNVDKVFVATTADATYLVNLINDYDIHNKSLTWLKQRFNTENAIQPTILYVESILGDKANYVIQKYTFSQIRTRHLYNEGYDTRQKLEALKLLFQSRLYEQIMIRQYISNDPMVTKQCTSNEPIPISRYADEVFCLAGIQNKYILDRGNIANKYSLTPEQIRLVLNVKDELQQPLNRTITVQDVALSIGESGLGGIQGCRANYISPLDKKILYFDFTSFYPTILVNNKDIVPNLNYEVYEDYLFQKKKAKNRKKAKAYKQLLNVTTGILGSSHDFLIAHRESYEAMVSHGHCLMLEQITYITNTLQLKLLQVFTDGCLFEVPKSWNTEIKSLRSEYEGICKWYDRIVIGNKASDYALISTNEYIGKGAYKESHLCNYIRDQLIASLEESQPYSGDYKEQDFVLYDTSNGSQYIMLEGRKQPIFEMGFNIIRKTSIGDICQRGNIDLAFYDNKVKELLNQKVSY